MAQAVITETGRRKLCKAHAGDAVLPKIIRMAVGDGGVDSSGIVQGTTGKEVGLYQELIRKEIDSHTYQNDEETTCRYSMRLDETELVGKSLSEIGLYDEEGDLVAYKTFLPKGKDEDMEFIFDMDEIF